MYHHLLALTWLASLHLSSISTSTLASPLIDRRASNSTSNFTGVCSTGIYAELGPHLATYQPAIAFCNVVFPPKCTTGAVGMNSTMNSTSSTTVMGTSTSISGIPTTTTNSATFTDPNSDADSASQTDSSTATDDSATSTDASTDSSSPTTTDSSTPTDSSVSSDSDAETAAPPPVGKRTLDARATAASKTTTVAAAVASAWHKGQGQHPNVWATLCSCIIKPTACPSNGTNSTSATTTSASTSRATCSPNRDEQAVQRCSSKKSCTLTVQSCHKYREGRDACLDDNRALLKGNATAIGYFYNSQDCVVYGADCCGKSTKRSLTSLFGTTSKSGGIVNLEAVDGSTVAVVSSGTTISFGT